MIGVTVEHPSTGRPAIARCLEIHDLVLSKCVRGEAKDYEFAEAALREGLAQEDVLLSRISDLPVTQLERARVQTSVRSIISKVGGG